MKNKDLVDRFLTWPLPNGVCSDLCATKQGYPNRLGTNLLTATEAEQMIQHVVGPLIQERDALREALEKIISTSYQWIITYETVPIEKPIHDSYRAIAKHALENK